ncbi:MAG: CBS and ACT domain-containing protein [Chloroflexota bacterium]|nr:CBS and ACT domain-containing protein [Chloroflexota bacterium]
MFVRDCMTRDPVTVRPESDPLAAVALLKCGDFRRLPVVDKAGNLVGIVAQNDLQVFLSQAESPGIIKRQHRVDQVMSHEVATVTPDCPLEEAASLMVKHKIGSLPVVENDQVVGIITETDIFGLFAAVLGGGTDSLRLTVQVPDVPGQLAELSSRIAQIGGNIVSVVAYEADQPERINITLRVERADQETVLEAISGQFRLDVLHVWDGTGQR